MPCYSRVASTVEFGPSTDPRLLANALASLGWDIRSADASALTAVHPRHGGSATFTKGGSLQLMTGPMASTPIDATEIKRAYSAQVIQSAAKRFGWSVTTTDATHYQVTRRF